MAAPLGEAAGVDGAGDRVILTPDQRVRVFVSSTMEELADERAAVRRAVEDLHLSPILFELGARAHPPRSLYRSYLEQSHVFVGIYWQRYGWVAPGMDVSGLEDEYLLAGSRPKLIYVKRSADGRESRLEALLDRIRDSDEVAYKSFSSANEIERLVAEDLSLLLSESFLLEPGAAPPRPARTTMPADATPFVGRSDEVAQVRALLERDDVRLVTLTGPGGIGKTRLALRAASDVAAGLTEEAAFVPLASIRDLQLVATAIASAVGLRDSTPGSTIDALRNDLADRSLLLVIDNLEHLIAAAGLVAELLAAAPRLKVLATSREALRVQAEHEFSVPPLVSADSVRLFHDRAAAVRHDFRIDDTNEVIVARICRRLEGVPLAIELAAARARLLPPAALLERLDRRLDFLADGPRDLPERQRTLRDTIQWSYDLLDDDERRLFAGLGVFVGSFSLGAVEAVLAGTGGRDPLDLLASLVDKSLLRAEATAAEPRFRMLEMIAEFARARLDESGDADMLGDRHAAFYRRLSLAIGKGARGPDQTRWLQVLGRDGEGEVDNLRAALAWFLSHRRLDEFTDMGWALWVPAWINGRLEEGRRVARGGLAAEGELSETSRARLLVAAGLFDMWKGDHSAALPVLREGLAIARTLGDDELIASAMLASGMLSASLEGETPAVQLVEHAIETYRRLGDQWGEAAALNVIAWLRVAQGDFTDAGPIFEQTLACALAVGDDHFAALAEVNLGEYRLHLGDVETAATLLESSAQRHRRMRSLYSVAYLLDAAARAALQRGNPAQGAVLLGASTHVRHKIGASVWGSQRQRRDELADRLRAALGDQAFAEASAAGAGLGYADMLDAVAFTD